MNFADIDKCECSNGLGVGVSLFVQGCHFHCKNCFNPETWDFDGGKEFTQETHKKILELIEPNYIQRFSVLGGEPLEKENLYELADLLMTMRLRKPSISIWLYSGYTYEDLFQRAQTNTTLSIILNQLNVLVDGQFQEDKKDLTYPFAGSTNQRIIDMRATREQNKIVLLDI